MSELPANWETILEMLLPFVDSFSVDGVEAIAKHIWRQIWPWLSAVLQLDRLKRNSRLRSSGSVPTAIIRYYDSGNPHAQKEGVVTSVVKFAWPPPLRFHSRMLQEFSQRLYPMLAGHQFSGLVRMQLVLEEGHVKFWQLPGLGITEFVLGAQHKQSVLLGLPVETMPGEIGY
jgi:hypothetical protein